MSSHHFVREGQEPALLILQTISFDSIAPLLEWAPTLMATDFTVETVFSWGVKVDVVLVPEIELTLWQQKLADQQPITIVTYQEETSIVVEACKILQSKHQYGLCLTHQHPEGFLPFAEVIPVEMNLIIMSTETRWQRITRRTFSKWYPQDATILMSAPQSTMSNLHSEQDHRYRVAQTGMVKIESETAFWVGEAL